MEANNRNTIIQIRRVSTEEELKTVHKIRHDVFVMEQAVDQALEYEFEEESKHFIALFLGEAAGTARWRYTEKGIKFERFAVLEKFRNQGVGEALLKAMLNDIPEGNYVYLHAQLPAMNLYTRGGFKAEGDLFYEADMPHYKMVLRS